MLLSAKGIQRINNSDVLLQSGVTYVVKPGSKRSKGVSRTTLILKLNKYVYDALKYVCIENK